MSIQEAITLRSVRDKLSRSESELEKEIFSIRKRTPAEAQALGRRYRQIKDRRTEASVRYAICVMQLSEDEQTELSKSFVETREGRRNGDVSNGGESDEHQD